MITIEIISTGQIVFEITMGVGGSGTGNGADGKSAYQLWLESGNSGTMNDFLNSLKGAQGATGATGAQGTQGDKGDKGDTGAAGANGADGATGATGATGANGADGKTWISSAANPSAGIGALGDYYLNTDTYDIFNKTGASTWSNIGNIKGAVGADGADGATGNTGANGADGAAGANAPQVQIQYSVDGVTSWHTTPTLIDAYAQFSTDNGMTWGDAIKFREVNILFTFSSIATAAGTTTLLASSAYNQVFTGTLAQTVVLPVASTLALGHEFCIINRSTGNLTINSSGGNLVQTLTPNSCAFIICKLNSGTTAASWDSMALVSTTTTAARLNYLTSAAGTTGTATTNLVFSTSPVLVTPTLGAATATSVNKVTITAPTTSATLTLAQGSTLATSGAFVITLTATAATNVTLPTTGTLATLAGVETFTNKTLVTPKVSIAVPSTNVDANGIIINATAGESLVFGDVCYIKSDGKFWKGKGDASTTAPIQVMAIATIAANAAGNMLVQGIARNDSWTWTVGGKLYLNPAVSGGITQTVPSTVGNQVQTIGDAISATSILFNPSPIVIEI